MSSQPRANKHLKLATFAVAFAAAMGGSAAVSAAELQSIEKIERYCMASWRNAGIHQQDWTDCTQQAITELLERISRQSLSTAIEQGDSEERRELNRSVWRTTQRWRRSTRWFSLDEARTATEASTRDATADAWEQVAAAGAKCLSERQQKILELTREGWKVAEIADHLEISAARVSDEKYKAISKLQTALGVA